MIGGCRNGWLYHCLLPAIVCQNGCEVGGRTARNPAGCWNSDALRLQVTQVGLVQIPLEDWCGIPKRDLAAFQMTKPVDKTAWIEMIVPAGSYNNGLVAIPNDIWVIPNDGVRLHTKRLKE